MESSNVGTGVSWIGMGLDVEGGWCGDGRMLEGRAGRVIKEDEDNVQVSGTPVLHCE